MPSRSTLLPRPVSPMTRFTLGNGDSPASERATCIQIADLGRGMAIPQCHLLPPSSRRTDRITHRQYDAIDAQTI
jgi:hypothetical protein